MPNLRRAAGLVTFPSEINKREGALEVADNVVIDADNIIESRRGFEDFGDSFGIGSDRLKQALTYKGRLLRHYGTSLDFDADGSGSFSTFDGTYTEVESGLRIKSTEVNGNLYFTTDEGIRKISALDASSLSTDPGYITEAGGVKALDVEASLNFSTGGFLDPQSKCAYRVLWGIRDANNNLIFGTPSPRVVLTNTSEDILTPEQFDLTFTSGTTTDYDGTVDDRFIQLSDSQNDYFIWFQTAGFPNPPQAPGTLGRISVPVNIDGLSSAGDIAIATGTVIEALGTFSVEVSGGILSVTSTENGEDLTDVSVSSNLTVVVPTIIEQGQITAGTSANAQITLVVPDVVDSTDYFYQLYRTAPVTATDEVDIIDLDPGDEMNLVFEAQVTDVQISAKEVTFEDITTEAFRATGAFLYTNPNTGEGILQANERPPIAKDITLFRNTAFYANTKRAHSLQFNLLSVQGFTSGTSELIIGDDDGFTRYTFVGETEVTNITTDSFANTLDTGYILLNSARDERKYYIWLDKGATADPAVANRTGIRVFTETGDTDADIAQKMSDSLAFIPDFTANNVGNVVTITNAKNGNTTDASIGSALGGAWAVSVTTQGDGEDTASQEILLSSTASIGQAIEETAQSIVKVINRDASSPVNAFYLSSPGDVPGIIFFERKSLEDKPFYIGTNDSSIADKFNPELGVEGSITAIAVANPAEITSVGHGLVTGDQIVIDGSDCSPSIDGTHTVTVLTPDTFTVPVQTFGSGTTGSYFVTKSVSDNEVVANRIYFSKFNEPEAVPLVNFIDVGPRDKAIKRILANRDNLFVLKEDGVYIITGTTSPNFSSRLLDNSAQITAPDTAVNLNNRIYCLTNQGVTTISETGVGIISRPIEDKILDVANRRFNYESISFAVSYETDRAYLLWLPTTITDTIATQCYRYNTFTSTWTRWTKPSTAGVVEPVDDLLYVSDGERNFLQQERKNRDRTDYSERSFELLIGANAVNEALVELSSVADTSIGDVIKQDQYVTIATINRLLNKLDRDTGLDDTDYLSTLRISAGGDTQATLDALNAKLVADDASGTVTVKVFSTDFATQQTQYNTLISELNDLACDTTFKNYKESTGITPYEALINSIDSTTNVVTLINELPLVIGPVTNFKSISKRVQWAPQHFGAPENLKQIREGTVIFDQNNFYNATVSYASDRSANFEEIIFRARNSGYWGGFDWGQTTWGGEGNEIPIRTYIPQDKQRCRFLKVRFDHGNARENVRILGISLEPRVFSTRGYR